MIRKICMDFIFYVKKKKKKKDARSNLFKILEDWLKLLDITETLVLTLSCF